jgi:cobalt/nickel transport system permease protein
LLGKSLQLSNEVHLAMLSRGFRGEVWTMDEFIMRPRDWIALAAFSASALGAIWMGR